MDNPNETNSIAVVFCNKGHIHQGQKLEFICLNTLCRKERLCCNICKSTKHKTHETMELELFIKEIERKAQTQLKMNSLNLLDEIDKKSMQCQTVMKAIQGYIKAKIDKIDAKVEMYYLSSKRDIARYNEILFPDQLRQLRKGSEIGQMEEQVQILLDQIVLKDGKVTRFFSSAEETKIIEGLEQSLAVFQKQLVESIKTIHNVVSEQYVKIQQACGGQEKETSIAEQSTQCRLSSNKRLLEEEIDQQKRQQQYVGSQMDQGVNYGSDKQEQQQYQQQRENQNLTGSQRLGKSLMRQGSDYVISGGSHSSNSNNNLQANRSNSSATRGRQTDDINVKQQDKIYQQQQQIVVPIVPSEMQQLQQSQMNLLKQIRDQQIQLEQLQKQQEFKIQSQNSSKQYQSQQQQQQSQSFDRSCNSGYRKEESKAIDGVLNISRTTSHVSANSNSPSRLLFYSSLFKQHTLSKQASYASPFSAYFRASSSSNTTQNNLSGFKSSNLAGNNNNNVTVSTSGNAQISHSKSSSSFIQQNNFLANNPGDKRTRWWDDETTSRMEQDIQESDFVNKKMEQMPRSLDRKIKFHFDKKLKHPSIECLGDSPVMTVRGSQECINAKLALLVPSLETQPPQEFKWAIKVINCQSIAYSNPLAVGMCLRKTVEEGSFDFQGEDNGIVDKMSNSKQLGLGIKDKSHGCYLLTAQGIIRNCSDNNQDKKQVGVRFDKGDTLLCEFNPFRKYIKIKNKETGKFCMINIAFDVVDKLYPCVRISYCMDVLQFSQDEEE